jgi:hypothetical protein
MNTSSRDRRVHLHVGVHKSGTTHLQLMLVRHRAALREQGVLHPGAQSRMFLAAVDVRGTHRAWGLRARDVRGSWDTLCRAARAHDGPTVLSHELFAAAAPRQVTAAMTMLQGLDVHVVVSTPHVAGAAAVDAVTSWRRAVPAANLHVIAVPAGPAGHELLWERFAGLVGFDAAVAGAAHPATAD